MADYGRRPFIVLGTLCVLLSMPMLIEARDIAIFVFGLAILQVGMNVVTAAYQSLTPDRVPKEQRGAASGYMGLMTILGNVSSLALAAWLFGQVGLNAAEGNTIHHGTYLFYILTSVILLAGVFVTVVGVHETPYKVSLAVSTQYEEQLPQRLQHWMHRNWLEPWHDYNFTVVFLTRFSVMMGLALFMTFIEYYFADVTHSSNFVQTTAAVAVLALLGAVFSAFLLGVFSDRVKRAPLVSIATVFMALAWWMQQPDFPADVRALYGITLLSRGAPRLGFTLRSRPKTFHTWLDRFFMTGLLVLYNPKGGARLFQGTTYGTYPQEAWMSRKELLQRYGGTGHLQEG